MIMKHVRKRSFKNNQCYGRNHNFFSLSKTISISEIVMVPSIPLVIFKFCTTKNLFKQMFYSYYLTASEVSSAVNEMALFGDRHWLLFFLLISIRGICCTIFNKFAFATDLALLPSFGNRKNLKVKT